MPGNTAGKAGNKAVFRREYGLRREYGIPGVTRPGSFCSIVEYEKMPSSLGLWSQVFHGNVGIRKAPFLLPSDQHPLLLKGANLQILNSQRQPELKLPREEDELTKHRPWVASQTPLRAPIEPAGLRAM